ncbi:MAG TPA: HPF/RaiA family ribosome-associated protein [Longimicrobiales bacterium]|nr:HPF/RaiA family ribosome-associated protein [Longimicrobiales bacterium]
MQIQVNTDSNIEGDADLVRRVTDTLEKSLTRFGEQLTRVEVHLSDQNSDQRSGARDKRCLIEARIAGLQPISVSDEAAVVDQAVSGAADKLIRSLDRTLARRRPR